LARAIATIPQMCLAQKTNPLSKQKSKTYMASFLYTFRAKIVGNTFSSIYCISSLGDPDALPHEAHDPDILR
jgi:hypothetical protein